MPQMIPLTQGSYMSRSVIASAQRCVNLYGDRNPEDSPFPFTFYPTPGLIARWSPATPAPARGAYTASNGDLYYVAGATVYYISANYNALALGNLRTSAGMVSMKDDGLVLIIVDGTSEGFKVDLKTRLMTPYAQAGFLGADRVDYLDGFFLFNKPKSRFFYSSLLNTQKIDPTYIAQKSAAPDALVKVVCVERLAWLMGTASSEVWANAGAPNFPFQEVPGAFVQHGLAAPDSVATHDNSIFFVEQNANGKGSIARTSGYSVQKISTPALEAEMATYATISDAIGMVYSMLGRVFYVVTFPSADVTWVFDMAHTPPMIHQWSWASNQGVSHRHRAICGAFAYGLNYVGDWQNGTLYELDSQTYLDDDNDVIRVRGFPHSVSGGRAAEYKQFQAEFEVGQDLPEEAQVSLRVSQTRGRSWGQPMLMSLGALGDYLRVPQWRQLGLARDVVFELEWSFNAQAALNGAYVDFQMTDG